MEEDYNNDCYSDYETLCCDYEDSEEDGDCEDCYYYEGAGSLFNMDIVQPSNYCLNLNIPEKKEKKIMTKSTWTIIIVCIILSLIGSTVAHFTPIQYKYLVGYLTGVVIMGFNTVMIFKGEE